MKKILTKIIMMTFRGLIYGTAAQIFLFGVLMARVSDAQNIQSVRDATISMDLRNASLVECFTEIEKQTDFKFSFDHSLIDPQVKINYRSKNKKVSDFLLQISKEANLRFKQVNNNINVQPIDQQSEEQVPEIEVVIQGRTVTGRILSAEDDSGLPGVNVVVKGTAQGSVTDIEGAYSVIVPDDDAVLVFSSVGFVSQEVVVGNRSVIDLTLQADVTALEEIVVIGYGTQKKVNMTGAVSVATSETFEARPVANVQQALQGVVPNLTITTSAATGEPGAEMSMNIRGLTSIEGNSDPFVLVDGIPMGINDIDPNDIESISVLKDVASSAIYGARAAYGVILITTKSGKEKSGVRFSYSNNFANTYLLNMPKNADALSFAHTMNHSAVNAGSRPYYTDERLGWIEQNLANPGSATEVEAAPNGLSWNLGVEGLNASAATDWHSIIFKDHGGRMKHNLNVSGGNEKFNYYLSGGTYRENGHLKPANDYFKRYNIDAKIGASATSWMDIAFLAKYNYQQEEFPAIGWADQQGRSFMMLLMTRIKPTKPAYFPGTEVWSGRIGEMESHKTLNKMRQLVLSPRITLEPVKDWVTNIELNYRSNDSREESFFPRIPSARPDGTGGSEIIWPSMQGTSYRPRMFTDTYMSPNIYSNYSKSFGKHNLSILVGYQHESYEYFNMLANATHLLTDQIPSISTAVGEKIIDDEIGHWSTQGVFGRLNYNFNEKYLVEVNGRFDGSSRFDPDNRWGFFPSVSAGWVASQEDFFPMKNVVDVFKLRGSYGTIGNQNVANYLYIPTMPISQGNFLFGGERLWAVGTPNMTSVDLSWETVSTLDFGFDMLVLNNRLGVTFDWYKSKTGDLVGPGQAVPAVLGTAVPKKNEGEITTKGWEIEVSWRNTVSDFSYGFRGVLSDYNSTVTKYTNPTKILSTYYEGMKLGEIWGLETAGLYQSEEEVTDWPVDPSFIYSGAWLPGDVKYIDQNGDNKITIGDNTAENPGDKKIIGNSTPRFQFGLGANASWKGFDISMLWQGVAKSDLDIRSLGTFRGPGNGPLHANVYEEHLDFWRDDTSPLGANPGAYFPNPYAQYEGQNNKNYLYPTTRYLQSGAYIRLKNLQIGYTIPRGITEKARITNARIYMSGENILTFTKLMIYDPEAFKGAYLGRVGDQYPLSRTFSLGLNINF